MNLLVLGALSILNQINEYSATSLLQAPVTCDRGSRDFVGAVFEYAKNESEGHRRSVDEVVKENLDNFRQAAKQAKSEGADIIVFPEDGILPTPLSRTVNIPGIPDPKTRANPCVDKAKFSSSPLLANLSCMARENNLYVVANIVDQELCSEASQTSCPSDGKFMYNTDVVFDRQGVLVARHRKRFLFFEGENNRALTKQLTVFDTDFGRFGVVICFDTMFGEAVEMIEKYNVDTVLVSTFWFNELPFLSSLQYFQAFAVGNGVNLLVANIHRPTEGALGSLIVSKDGSVLDYTFKVDEKSKLLVGKIPANPNPNSVASRAKIIEGSRSDVSTPKYNYLISNMDNFTVVPLDASKGSDQIEACNNRLCCKLKYSSSKMSGDYYLAVYDGLMNVRDHYFWYHQICSLFTCAGQWKDSKFSCQSVPDQTKSPFDFQLTGNMTAKHIYPSVLAFNTTLLPSSYWQYQIGEPKLSGSTKDLPLLSATLYGRSYELDPPYYP